jgi:LPS sulfotransferase NodH
MNTREAISRLRGKANSVYSQTIQRAYFSLLGRQVDQRFAIIAHARTGSNFLLDGLKTSPAIRVYHEIFASHNREIGKDFEKILSSVYQNQSPSTRMVGFKVFYNHLTDDEWKKLVAHDDLKIIHLTRRNRLRTILSLEIAFKTGQWTEGEHSRGPKEKRVTLDPLKLWKQLEQIEEGEAATRDRFCDRQVLEVVYEELVRAPDDVFEAVSAYLGLDGVDPGKIRLKRQNPESLEQLIMNYAEIKAVLQDTRFAEYLHS